MKRLCLTVLLITLLLCFGCAKGPVGAPPAEDGQNKSAAQWEAKQLETAENSDNIGPVEKVNEIKTPAGEAGAVDHAKPGQQGAGTNQLPDQAGQPAGDTTAESKGPTATLWVTGNFGAEKLFAGPVSLGPRASVMDLLTNNLKVETQYGGGFVNSINGLASGYTGADKKTRDWFYYVNGIITSVGALDYRPAPGEIIWWDYHDWGTSAFTPALIGAFPEPFRSGYRGINPGTLILAAAGHEQQGEKLAACLKSLGVKQAEVKPYSESLLSEDKKITIVIGLWNQFKDDKYWTGLQKQRQKTGLFVELNPEYFAALDDKGAVVRQYKQNAGAIVATGSGMGDSTPVWLVTGLDTAGLEAALNTLIKNPRAVKQHFGALVEGDKIIGVPVAR